MTRAPGDPLRAAVSAQRALAAPFFGGKLMCMKICTRALRRRRRGQPARPPVARAVSSMPSGGDDPGLDAHNVMRVKSMSDRALQTRIWKIRRVDKLQSFIKVPPSRVMPRCQPVSRALCRSPRVSAAAPIPRLHIASPRTRSWTAAARRSWRQRRGTLCRQ